MTDYYPLIHHGEPESACSNLLRLATVGAVIGASAAAAGNYRQVKRDQMEVGQAILETGKTAAATGLATALAGAVAGAVSDQGLLRLGVLFATGAVTMYGIHEWLEKSDVER